MSNNSHEAQYYQAVVTDLTAANERLTEQNQQRLQHIERLRAECVDLRTIVSVCSLYLAAVEGRGMLDENDLLMDLTQRLNAYLETKKVTQ
jgi:enamine deaminase RidA (YjgF/YER057c/UK114 family)